MASSFPSYPSYPSGRSLTPTPVGGSVRETRPRTSSISGRSHRHSSSGSAGVGGGLPSPSIRKKLFSNAKKHPKFFFADGSVVFLVQNMLFKVHKSILSNASPYFHDLFAVPPPHPPGIEGTEDDPIIFSDITSDAFERLLAGLYVELPLVQFSTPALIDMLKLSTKWEIQQLRDFCIASLSSTHHPRLTPVQQICLSRSCAIPQWLLPGFTALARTRMPLNILDAKLLGLESLLQLTEARDAIVQKRINTILRTELRLNAHENGGGGGAHGSAPSEGDDGKIPEEPEGEQEHEDGDQEHDRRHPPTNPNDGVADPDGEPESECAHLIRRELTRLYAEPPKLVPDPARALLELLHTSLGRELCARCEFEIGLPGTGNLELRVRRWLDMESDDRIVADILAREEKMDLGD